MSIAVVGGCDAAQRAETASSAEAQTASNVASSTTAATPAAKTRVTFVKKVPQAGTVASSKRQTSSKFTMAGKTYREAQTSVSEVTVKQSDDFRVTKASIDVKELFTTSQQGTGAESRSVSPLAGSTYIVTRNEDGKLSALDSSGNKVPAGTVKLIKDEFGSAFEKSQDAAFLPERELKLEEKLMPASDAMLAALGIKDDGNTLIDGTEFILTEIDDDDTQFDVNLTMTQKVGALRVRAKLKGTMDIRPDGAWITAAELKGPITILDGAGNEKGSGELSFTASQQIR